MRFSVVNLGCKVNRVESDSIAAALLSHGARQVDDNADVVVVNTCTVTGEAQKKTRKAVRRALRDNPSARVFVTGCAAVIDADEFSSMDARVAIVQKANVVQAVLGVLGKNDASIACAEEDPLPLLRMGASFPTRVGVKVQDGCNNACTYCIVHVARGAATSRDYREVIHEVDAYAQAGVREFVLSGINLGAYDFEGLQLPGLFGQLLDVAPHARFRLSSIEPRDVSDELIALMAQSQGRICRHLHLPLQSGSNEVLHQMARPYTADYYVSLVARLRDAMPAIALSTDIIVGFPGETEEQFLQTVEVAKQCAFAKIHVFPYSQREGTPAAKRIDQVPAQVKAQRARTMRELGARLAQEDYAARIGTEELVLVEEGSRGMTESYREITVPAATPIGELIMMSLPSTVD